jgi:hypothetical protein
MRLTVIQIQVLSNTTRQFAGDVDFWISQNHSTGQIIFHIGSTIIAIDRDGTVTEENV